MASSRSPQPLDRSRALKICRHLQALSSSISQSVKECWAGLSVDRSSLQIQWQGNFRRTNNLNMKDLKKRSLDLRSKARRRVVPKERAPSMYWRECWISSMPCIAQWRISWFKMYSNRTLKVIEGVYSIRSLWKSTRRQTRLPLQSNTF